MLWEELSRLSHTQPRQQFIHHTYYIHPEFYKVAVDIETRYDRDFYDVPTSSSATSSSKALVDKVNERMWNLYYISFIKKIGRFHGISFREFGGTLFKFSETESDLYGSQSPERATSAAAAAQTSPPPAASASHAFSSK